MTFPFVSIVIRCYNEQKHIGKLLNGIENQTIRDKEVIIVDSGSTDDTLKIASAHPVKILSIKPEDFSFGRALNLGCEEAKGEFLVFASAHVYPVYQDWLENLLKPFDDDKVALVYGKQRGNEITKYSEHQIFAKWFPNQSKLQEKQPFCNNANLAIRRALWQQFPYDEKLTGLEDLDWAKRIIKEGYHLAYSADAKIIHVHHESPQRIYNRYRREAIALKNIFPEQTFNIFDFIRLFSSNMISDYYHASQDQVLISDWWEILLFRLMQFWGTYQGFQRKDELSNQLKQTFYYPHELTRKNENVEQERDPENNARKIEYDKEYSKGV